MNIFETIKEYEQLVFINEKDIGLKGIICIHNTTLGPALGGCRLFNYASEEEAIFDVTRLAKGMTYKSAISGLNWGGGKAVIIGDTKSIKREYIFKAFGKYIEGLNGRYITAEDVNTTTTDMSYVNESTNYVAGLLGKSGNPSWFTAKGTYYGIKAAVKEQFKTDSLKGLRVALQGLGSVAAHLAEMLHNEGAKLIVTDINQQKCQVAKEKFAAKVVEPNSIISADCDIFSPCAMGAVINDNTINTLKAKVIAGCANNQLLEEKHADELAQKGILYAPDYVVNAGGLINVTREFHNMNEEIALKKISNIYNTILEIFAFAKEKRISTFKAANLLAEERIQNVQKLDRIFTQRGKIVFNKTN